MAKTAAQPAPTEHVQKVEWNDVKSRVAFSDLVKAVDDSIAKSKNGRAAKFPIFRVTYQYGDEIVKNGNFRSPCGTKERAEHCTQCLELNKSVKEAPIPLSLVLRNCVEVYKCYPTQKERTAPLGLFKEGALFGLFETVDKIAHTSSSVAPPWSVSAGARSIHIVGSAKQDSISRHLLQRTQFPVGTIWEEIRERPWQFVQLFAQAEGIEWPVELLIFSDEWMNAKDMTSSALHNLMFRNAWTQSQPLRTQWRDAIEATMKQDDDPYYHRTVTHLKAIANGESPVFEPVTRKEGQTGPLLEFRDWLEHVLKQKTGVPYVPAILQPCYLNTDTAVGYYSISLPSMPGPLPREGRAANSKEEMEKIFTLAKRTTNISLQRIWIGVAPKKGEEKTGNIKTEILPERFLPPEGQVFWSSASYNRVSIKNAKLSVESQPGTSFFTACFRVTRT
jgi:hypothetical protein